LCWDGRERGEQGDGPYDRAQRCHDNRHDTSGTSTSEGRDQIHIIPVGPHRLSQPVQESSGRFRAVHQAHFGGNGAVVTVQGPSSDLGHIRQVRLNRKRVAQLQIEQDPGSLGNPIRVSPRFGRWVGELASGVVD
jgi:hypothetical protein